MLIERNTAAGPLLAVDVTEFSSVVALRRWRRRARTGLVSQPGLCFARAMTMIGSASSGGFGAGVPALSRQVLLSVWRSEPDWQAYAAGNVAPDLQQAGSESSRLLFDVVSSRGAHRSLRPLIDSGSPDGDGVFGALTLGRCAPRSLPRFLREGTRLGPYVDRAEGVLAAVSAGNPLTGNCTVSLWRSEAAMLSFAYGLDDGHRRTAASRPPILRDQLSARLRLRQATGRWAAALVCP